MIGTAPPCRPVHPPSARGNNNVSCAGSDAARSGKRNGLIT
jgi:hypothetical protein